MSAPDALAELADLLTSEPALLASAVKRPDSSADRSRSELIDGGTGADEFDTPLRLAVEATREAELLHHAPERARLIKTDDRDLALLIGDRLYALGLGQLAQAGRVEAVEILSDIVAAIAQVHAPIAWQSRTFSDHGTGDPVDAEHRCDELWRLACTALVSGKLSSATAEIKELAKGHRSPSRDGRYDPLVPQRSPRVQ